MNTQPPTEAARPGSAEPTDDHLPPLRPEFAPFEPMTPELESRFYAVARGFSYLLALIEELGSPGREFALARTALQEAQVWACRAVFQARDSAVHAAPVPVWLQAVYEYSQLRGLRRVLQVSDAEKNERLVVLACRRMDELSALKEERETLLAAVRQSGQVLDDINDALDGAPVDRAGTRLDVQISELRNRLAYLEAQHNKVRELLKIGEGSKDQPSEDQELVWLQVIAELRIVLGGQAS